MGYRKQSAKKGYANRRRITVNPVAFTNGFEGAMKKAEELAAQGWIVDTDQGALDSEQAAEVEQQAKKMGFDTEVIPIVKEGDEVLAQFIAVKPKPQGTKPQGTAPQETGTQEEEAGPPVTTNTVLEPEQVQDSFIKHFYRKGRKPDPSYMDNGFIMMPSKVGALIRRDATPQKDQTKQLVEMTDQNLQNPAGAVTAEAMSALAVAKNQKKQYLVLGPTGAETKVPLDRFMNAVKVLGGGGRVQLNTQAKDALLFLKNPEGDRMILTPVVGESTPFDVTYNDALVYYRNNLGA